MTTAEPEETLTMPFLETITPEEEAGVAELADQVKEQVTVRVYMVMDRWRFHRGVPDGL